MNNSTNFKVEFSTNSAPSTRVPAALAIFVITFVGISILVATIGNARVLLSLKRRQDLRKVPHYLLANLALTGLLSALINMPLLIIMTTVNYFEMGSDLPPALEVTCKVVFPSCFSFLVLNALTLSLMAFDRQDCVLRPFNRRLTRGKVKKIIPLTWILSLLTAALFGILIRNEKSVCVEFYPYNNLTRLEAIHIAIAVVAQFDTITVLIITVTFFRILKELRSSTVNPSNSASRREERKLTKFTNQVCAVFLLFRAPIIACHLVTNVAGYRGATTNSATLVTVTLAVFQYVANPFLHHKMLQVRAPNQRTNLQLGNRPEQQRALEQARSGGCNGVELTRFVRFNPP